MLFILCLVNRKRLLPIFLSLISLVVLIPQSVISRIFSVNTLDVGVSERLLIWEGALKAIGKSPLFGLGPGIENFWGVMLQSGINAPHAHNLALQLMVEGGIIALGLVAFAGWKISRVGFDLLGRRETRLLGGVFLAFVCAFIANSMVEFPFPVSQAGGGLHDGAGLWRKRRTGVSGPAGPVLGPQLCPV